MKWKKDRWAESLDFLRHRVCTIRPTSATRVVWDLSRTCVGKKAMRSFYRAFKLPPPGTYGVGMTFLPVEKHERIQCEGILERIPREEGLTVLGWRDTPVDASAIGRVARGSQPYIQQLFVGAPAGMQ